MAGYAAVFDAIGLRDWCDEDKKPSLLSLSKLKGEQPEWYDEKFPSLDYYKSLRQGSPNP